MVRASLTAWVVVRAGQVWLRLARPLSLVCPPLAAWESGAGVVFWKVAMVRAPRSLGYGQGGSG